eukprot:8784259-Pyramimonas_sp.AAC.1
MWFAPQRRAHSSCDPPTVQRSHWARVVLNLLAPPWSRAHSCESSPTATPTEGGSSFETRLPPWLRSRSLRVVAPVAHGGKAILFESHGHNCKCAQHRLAGAVKWCSSCAYGLRFLINGAGAGRASVAASAAEDSNQDMVRVSGPAHA